MLLILIKKVWRGNHINPFEICLKYFSYAFFHIAVDRVLIHPPIVIPIFATGLIGIHMEHCLSRSLSVILFGS